MSRVFRYAISVAAPLLVAFVLVVDDGGTSALAKRSSQTIFAMTTVGMSLALCTLLLGRGWSAIDSVRDRWGVIVTIASLHVTVLAFIVPLPTAARILVAGVAVVIGSWSFARRMRVSRR